VSLSCTGRLKLNEVAAEKPAGSEVFDSLSQHRGETVFGGEEMESV